MASEAVILAWGFCLLIVFVASGCLVGRLLTAALRRRRRRPWTRDTLPF